MNHKHVFPNSQSLVAKDTLGSKVSIITRTKNRPALLVRAIYSVLSQTHEDWELIIINDGGNKKCVEEVILKFASSLNNRLHIVHHEVSKGMEAASNAGLKLATGDFLIIHDDDDAWHPDFLKRTVKYLNQDKYKNYAAVASNCTVVFEQIKGDTVIETKREAWSYWREHVDYKDLLCTNLFPPICLLVRKPIADYLSGFNENLPVLGDWDFILRLIQVGDIGTINEPLAYYHHREPLNQPDEYGNSVVAGQSLHKETNIIYRNSLMRAYAASNPNAIGALITIIADLEARDKRIHQRLNHLEWMVSQSNLLKSTDNTELFRAAEGINTLLRIPRFFWRRIYLLRLLIARARGRV